MDRAGEPSVVLTPPVAEELEVLHKMSVGRLRMIECVDHADTFHWPLPDAIDDPRLR